jgi:hypothetical protein
MHGLGGECCRYNYVGYFTSSTQGVIHKPILVQYDSWLGHPKTENTKRAITPDRLNQLQIFILGTSNNDTWHNTQVYDLTYFWRSQRSKFKMALLVGMFRLNQLQIFILGTSINDAWHNTQVYDLTYLWRSQRSKFKMALLVGMFRSYLT